MKIISAVETQSVSGGENSTRTSQAQDKENVNRLLENFMRVQRPFVGGGIGVPKDSIDWLISN